MAVFGPLSGQARGRSPVGGHLGCFESFAVRTRQPFQGDVSIRDFPRGGANTPRENVERPPALGVEKAGETGASPRAWGGAHGGSPRRGVRREEWRRALKRSRWALALPSARPCVGRTCPRPAGRLRHTRARVAMPRALGPRDLGCGRRWGLPRGRRGLVEWGGSENPLGFAPPLCHSVVVRL